MTWSYSVTDLATNAKDQLRLLIGDTNSSNQQLQDEELYQFVYSRSNLYGAAAEACRSLATNYSVMVTQRAGAGSLNYSDIAKAYAARAATYDALSASMVMPYAGGISITDKLNQEQNTDRVPPQFNIGMDDDLIPFPPTSNETPDEQTNG